MSTLKNIKPEEVPIEMGGKTYTLLFDLNAMATLEEMYGNMDAVNEALKQGSIKGTQRLVWVGIQHMQEPKLDRFGEPVSWPIGMYEIGKMLGLADMEDIAAALNKSLESAMPPSDDKKDDADLTAVEKAERLRREKHPEEFKEENKVIPLAKPQAEQ